jgi:UDP:flavonoid glycosyltransferase YjiC (YdhE family)
MWGQQTVPQIQVLSTVDLFLTHGGNNIFTETLYFGKPIIVLPLFGDQHIIAQRIH